MSEKVGPRRLRFLREDDQDVQNTDKWDRTSAGNATLIS
jgi:hypothetical protein